MRKEVGKYVSAKIYAIAKDEKSLESGGSKAHLANLRRGVGKTPGEIPELWGEFLQNLPEELIGKTDSPSYAEWAIYTALTLFALHQQGHSRPMNEAGTENSLGRAVSQLVEIPKGEEEIERIKFKLSLAANSEDMIELAYHLKTLVRLLSQSGIKLDYISLAEDLYKFQFDEYADKVRLKWGRDFYCGLNFNERKEENNE